MKINEVMGILDSVQQDIQQGNRAICHLANSKAKWTKTSLGVTSLFLNIEESYYNGIRLNKDFPLVHLTWIPLDTPKQKLQFLVSSETHKPVGSSKATLTLEKDVKISRKDGQILTAGDLFNQFIKESRAMENHAMRLGLSPIHVLESYYYQGVGSNVTLIDGKAQEVLEFSLGT